MILITLLAPVVCNGAPSMREVINKIAKEENVDARLLSAICFVESSHIATKINLNDGKGHSYGICQIKLPTAAFMGFKGTSGLLMTPEVNVRYAAKYLSYQLIRYKGDMFKSVAAYNSGTYKEHKNCQYVQKVFNAYVQNR